MFDREISSSFGLFVNGSLRGGHMGHFFEDSSDIATIAKKVLE